MKNKKEFNQIEKYENKIMSLENKLQSIKVWVEAYPLKIFPEPDFAKVEKVLKRNKLTLASISASNMRHVLSGIKTIIERGR